MLVVSECFGPTFQGEGPSLGRRAGFLRLGRCNLACDFCDTRYTWDWDTFDPTTELHHAAADDLATQLRAMDVPLVVITGGEPLLQQAHLVPLLEALDTDIEIETAGTIAPDPAVIDLVTRFNVSPKLANSGNPAERRYKPDVLQAFQATGKAAFKFVVTDDFTEVDRIVEDNALTNVWVMPEGTDAATVVERTQRLAGPAAERGWNLTTRLHVLLWGNERGR